MGWNSINKIMLGIFLVTFLCTSVEAQQDKKDASVITKEKVHLREVPFPQIKALQRGSSFDRPSLDELIRRWWLYRGKTKSYRGAPSSFVFGKKEKIKIPWKWQGFSVESTFSKNRKAYWNGLLKVVYEDNVVRITEDYNPEKILVVNKMVIFNGMEQLTFALKKRPKAIR